MRRLEARSGLLRHEPLALASSALLGLCLAACSTDAHDGIASGGAAGSAGSAGESSAGATSAGSSGSSGAPGNEAGASGQGEPGTFCAQGKTVPGAAPSEGFCVREFASVPEARTLLVAPNGDVFVASPSMNTPGGAANGLGQILVISDDDHDGVGELHVFAKNLPDVHGIALGGGYLYFTSGTSVFRTSYVEGQRAEVGPREDLMMPTTFGKGRWTHGLALSVGGALLASSGEYSSCGVAPTGSISQVAKGSAALVAVGFRNPMYMRCHYKEELCAANELGEDQVTGAFEKFVAIRPDTNYGYPCCFGAQQPRVSSDGFGCQAVASEDASYTLADTPFGFDWERGHWPAPYKDGVFVALHGSAYSSPAWRGVKIVYAPTDPNTHLPLRDAWREFVGGFGPSGGPLERPSDIAFSEDGRLFFSDDTGNHVYWVAPVSLRRP